MPLPIPPGTRQYQIWAKPVATIAEVITLAGWLQPLALPPAHLVEPGLGAAWTQYHTGFTVPAAATVSLDWATPLSEPVRIKPSAVREQAFTIDWQWSAPTTPVTYWWSALSEPVRTEPGLSAAWTQYHTGFLVPAPVTDIKAFQPLSEPVRVKARAPWFQPFTVAANYAPFVRSDSWHGPFSEPVRSKKSVPWQQAFTTDWNKPAVAIEYWWGALSEPVRLEPGLGAAWTQYHTGFLVPAAVTTTYNWFSPLSEPPPIEIGLGAAYQQVSSVGTAGAFTQLPYPPFSEPVRIKQGLHASRQQFLVYTPFTPAVTDLRNYWYQPFSEPVRAKKAVTWQQFLAVTANYAPFVFADSWWRPLSEPVRSKPDVRWREPFTTDWQWTAPAQIADLRWYSAFSEPVRSKKSVPWQQFFTTDWAQITDLRVYWYQPLTEPVRSKKAIVWQQFFATDPTTPAAVTDLRNFWYQPLAEPVRFKKSVPWQQPVVMDWKWSPPTGQVFGGWYRPFSEPQRQRQGLHASRQQFFVTDWQWRAPVQFGWYQWLREPVRQKQGLHAARQQFYTTDWKWSPPTSGLVAGWHQWLSEPVRHKQGLHASRQQFFAMDWKWTAPPVVAISYTLNSTEQGDFGRLFYASMDIVVGAFVTVTEEQIGHDAIVVITERSE